jgi:methylmalonyl-CoA mutase
MALSENLFEAFPPTSKGAWLAKIEKDLKGKPLADLQWQLEENIELAPFYHPDDEPFGHAPLQGQRAGNDWEIGEYLGVNDFDQANAHALEALMGGAEALLFRLQRHLDHPEQLAQLLRGIDPAIASIHFEERYTALEPWAIFRQFADLIEQRGIAGQKIRGSIDFDPILDWSNPPIDKLAELMRHCLERLPHFRVLQINAQRFHSGPDDSSMELAYALAKGSEYLARLTAVGLPAAAVNAQAQFAVSISKSYFVEIAKLRALRLLWANVLKAYGIEDGQGPFIVAHFAEESQDENANTNMIRASTQAMSAAIGGAELIYVLPANHALDEASTAFTRRIARNVQHILKMESRLHQVLDPGAGSYYIEKLTEKLAAQAWAKFQELEASGEFA